MTEELLFMEYGVLKQEVDDYYAAIDRDKKITNGIPGVALNGGYYVEDKANF